MGVVTGYAGDLADFGWLSLLIEQGHWTVVTLHDQVLVGVGVVGDDSLFADPCFAMTTLTQLVALEMGEFFVARQGVGHDQGRGVAGIAVHAVAGAA